MARRGRDDRRRDRHDRDAIRLAQYDLRPPTGGACYLAGLKSADALGRGPARSDASSSAVGPFGNVVRPFTVNGAGTLVFVNVNDLLGFEIGDLRTGKVLHRVEVQGYQKGPVKRHGCPSHGIALTPDERELWLADCANSAIHVFDATSMPPKQVTTCRCATASAG